MTLSSSSVSPVLPPFPRSRRARAVVLVCCGLLLATGGAAARPASMELTMRYDRAAAELVVLQQRPVETSGPRRAAPGPGHLVLRLEDGRGRALAEVPVADPTVAFADALADATGRLTGGPVDADDGVFVAVVPYDARIARARLLRARQGRARSAGALETLAVGRVDPGATSPPPRRRAGDPVGVTVVDHGPAANRIDLVFVGDGFRESELTSFASLVDATAVALFAAPPLAEYQRYFNVHRVDVVSPESGADHPFDGTSADTALDCSYNAAGGATIFCDGAKVFAAAAHAPAPADLVLVAVNDPAYGGGGGVYTTFSAHQFGPLIALHEFGHSFGRLADEYVTIAGTYTGIEPTAANITAETDRSDIKWSAWIEPSTPLPTRTGAGSIGLYEGAGYYEQGLYRGTLDSKMRSLFAPFGPINGEELVRRIHQYVAPIDAVTPVRGTVTLERGEVQAFSVAPIQPVGHDLQVAWYVDGNLVGGGPSFVFDADEIGVGQHLLRAEVVDPTPMVRTDPSGLLSESKGWLVAVGADPGGSIVVAGRIHDLAGRPLEGVVVKLRGLGRYPDGSRTEAVTDADGRYLLADLETTRKLARAAARCLDSGSCRPKRASVRVRQSGWRFEGDDSGRAHERILWDPADLTSVTDLDFTATPR